MNHTQGNVLDARGLTKIYRMGESLGAPLLRDGRWVESGRADEAVVLDAFAGAHQLQVGDRVPVVLAGVRRELTITGIASAPEYVFAIAPGEMIPDGRRFAVLWMDREVVARVEPNH
jgi:putative ABC transport system permease protein